MKKGSEYICTNCGYKASAYLGRCPECKNLGTLEKVEIEAVATPIKNMLGTRSVTDKSEKLTKIVKGAISRIDSGSQEFNRVVGGGIVEDSINILTAPPGMGKSTILLEVANYIAENRGIVLYVSGEESKSQIKDRADRILGKISDRLYVRSDTMLENILSDVEKLSPVFLIIDSIQMLYSNECDGVVGGDKQSLACVNAIIYNAKILNKYAVFLVGQMTKEDELRGSREVEHSVDGVFYLDKVGNTPVRLMRATKNRFGNSDEVGMFEMNSGGLEEIKDPAHYFTSLHKTPQIGCALSVIKEGTRSIITEIEALCENNNFSYPQRIARGLSNDQLKLYIAIMEKMLKVKLGKRDVYVQICGGLNIKETSIGLATCAAIYSVATDIPIPQDMIFIGEVGLTGHIKKIADIETTIRDCERFGFKTIIIPSSCSPLKHSFTIDIKKLSSLDELSKML